MSRYIIIFSDITDDNRHLVGGKGGNLGILYQAGLPVPPGFCVTTQAYKDFIRQLDIDEKIETAHSTGDLLRIGEVILKHEISQDICDQVVESYKQLGFSDVVVRSSGSAEDLPDAAFAGQYETFLNISVGDLCEYVKRCWASLWTARAIVYRKQKEISHQAALMGVVVQQMIVPSVSGIMFTAHPQTYDRSQIVIESSWEFGDLVVTGEVDTDSYTISKNKGRIVSKRIVEKERISTLKKGILIQANIPWYKWYKKKKETLTEPQLALLVQYGKQIEEIYSKPQDIEWAICEREGKLWILQSRAITSKG